MPLLDLYLALEFNSFKALRNPQIPLDILFFLNNRKIVIYVKTTQGELRKQANMQNM